MVPTHSGQTSIRCIGLHHAGADVAGKASRRGNCAGRGRAGR
jgi:hypothetical protein